MDPFDPALHYGPNDAGASALSIALVVAGILFGSWAFGAFSALIGNYFKGKKKD
ncbi:hypothetical protein [Prochlorococcus marinus]|uniref:Uncharacterized protein n=1 Tax=Prochlorococcus marinus (strain MIT 9211) TaxID=93059 RepID=A9BBY5_PROM4|nr:hypothetical protein [Prochlorococcus marinus]ABX09347.1 Hypothetical protein P9211_14161 [Prochlorococcus marinus str. MIT 9211]